MREELDDPHDPQEYGGELPDDDEDDEAEMSPDEVKAAMLVDAVETFVTALMMISAAEGPDHPDDFERAYLCVKRMHRIACNALVAHGFEPRRLSID